jgi:hypothetical protein
MTQRAVLERQKEFASRLSLMREEAGRLGLYATMQLLADPLRMVGFEISGDIMAGSRHIKEVNK